VDSASTLLWWESDDDWRVPRLWRSEFRHVLLKYVRSALLRPEQALAIWETALQRIQPGELEVDGAQVLELAIRSGCSTYDAEFVVLAQQLQCPLLTFDRKLLQLFPDVALQPGS
jgi:predicted nucleic acid-binding protein